MLKLPLNLEGLAWQTLYSKAVWLGIVAGMRSMSAPAIVSRHYSSVRSADLDASALSFIASPTHAALSNILASGERVADKFPFIPDRIDPSSLGFRALSGGLCGAVICTAERENRVAGALPGHLQRSHQPTGCITYGKPSLKRPVPLTHFLDWPRTLLRPASEVPHSTSA